MAAELSPSLSMAGGIGGGPPKVRFAMKDTGRLLQGVEDFNQGRFVEAFLQFEEVWMWERHEARKRFYRGLIQVAGALHHLVDGNHTSARRLHRSSLVLLADYPSGYEGIDVPGLVEELRAAASLFESPPGDLQGFPFPAIRFQGGTD